MHAAVYVICAFNEMNYGCASAHIKLPILPNEQKMNVEKWIIINTIVMWVYILCEYINKFYIKSDKINYSMMAFFVIFSVFVQNEIFCCDADEYA